MTKSEEQIEREWAEYVFQDQLVNREEILMARSMIGFAWYRLRVRMGEAFEELKFWRRK